MKGVKQPAAVLVPTSRRIMRFYPLLVSILVASLTFISLTLVRKRSLHSYPINSSCPLCSFKPLNPPTSTKRDVVLAAALTGLKRVEFFLRTLRSTGTSARIILFVDSTAQVSPEWLSFFASCDIEPVYVNHTSDVIASAPKLSRYYFYQQWLSKNIKDVDRVLHTDTFDVIFQSDPFIPSIRKDKLYLTFEPVTLRDSYWTLSWMNQCYGTEFTNKYGGQLISCSGVTAGGGSVFLKYLEMLISTPKWLTCFGHSLDQAHHNYLLLTGQFEKNGIIIEEFGCDSPYLTMHFCCKKHKCTLSDEGIMYGSNPLKPPVLLHQYNRWKNLTERNKNLCESPNNKVLELTKEHPQAEVVALPPLITNFPVVTLTPVE